MISRGSELKIYSLLHKKLFVLNDKFFFDKILRVQQEIFFYLMMQQMGYRNEGINRVRYEILRWMTLRSTTKKIVHIFSNEDSIFMLNALEQLFN